MTQQPYYPPQYPQAPQPPAPPNQAYPPQQPPNQAYPPQAPQQPYGQPYPPQQYQQPYAPQPAYGQPAAPQQPAQPLAQGSLSDFYSQPSTGGGKGISWSDAQGNQRPIGTTFMGEVVRDVTSADVSQITNREGVPQFYRDGRPKFQMKIPLKNVAMFDGQGQPVQLPAEFTDGEASWYVKGQARDELVRAMSEANATGDPAAGAVVTIQLVQRKGNGGGMNPSNIVAVRYQAPNGGQSAQQPAAPEAQAPAPQPVAPPVAQPQQQAPQGYAQEQYATYAQQPQGQQAPTPQPVAQQAPQYGQQPQAPQQPAYAQPAPQAAAPAPAGAVPAPSNMSPEQAALFARITGGQQA